MFMITAALIILVVGGVAWWGSARFRTPTDPLRN
jgi:hypothetical protein